MTRAHADRPTDRIRLRGRFNHVEVDARDVISFPDGIPGFERCRGFVLIESSETAPLKCLHSVDGPETSFLAIDPKLVLPDYRFDLREDLRLKLGATDEGTLVWLAIVMVEQTGDIAVNLRAPIVINPRTMVGRQVMPNNCVYPLRHVITMIDE